MAKNESSENYLEAILMLSKKLPVVRSVDIANELGFKKSSVSIAMKKLRQENHITVTDAGFIYLTDSGKEIANMIYERHEFISKWLIEQFYQHYAQNIGLLIKHRNFSRDGNPEKMQEAFL
mgnify:CR=1 FL=1